VGFLPRFLGFWRLVNGFAYVIITAVAVLAPSYHERPFLIAQPALFGELAILLFLLIKGANVLPLTSAMTPTLGLARPEI
jgi:hypothetical protein